MDDDAFREFCERHRHRGVLRIPRAAIDEAARRAFATWRRFGLPVAPDTAGDPALYRGVLIELDRLLEQPYGDWFRRTVVRKGETR